MTEKYGVPVWASFVLFGVIVVLLGLLLGMVSIVSVACVLLRAQKNELNTQ